MLLTHFADGDVLTNVSFWRRSLDVVLDHEQKLDCLGPQRLRRIIVRSDSLVKQLPWGHKS